MSNQDIVGRAVWLEMDRERSSSFFTPRKAMLVHVFEKPFEKEAVAAELEKPAIIHSPLPRRLTHVVLTYSFKNEESIFKSFSMGHSYARVMRLKHVEALDKPALDRRDVSPLGFAQVWTWPK